jgi:hypothetical protein
MMAGNSIEAQTTHSLARYPADLAAGTSAR